jgi:DnaJ-class molecular chaperone
MVRPGRACGDCGGQKVKQTKRTFEVRLPKGLPNGHTHTIKEKGSFSPEDMTNADVRLAFVYALPCREESGNGCQVEVQRIENADVHVRVTVTLAELLCRFETTVRMWSKPIKIRSSAYFNPRESYRFPGAGMPRFKKDGEFGDIVATFDVTFPPGRDFAKYSPVFAKALRLGGDPSAAAAPPPDPNAAAAADVFLCDLTPGVQQGGGGVAGSTL